ncbi:hypothetical protein G6O69_01670 [Pseudenhygromyxa sp. WMMC2535]|uniref:hypothetical protein n=1 Tax=Pseudenhygromyxa sp. WMMC2535 TaxID=2712867 RepID=UPI001557744D|nr:hypothetical protein [Pseudenhygromyxa sp. WMMC2535]NVB36522.1 hypothetical protein [Pseudenhygromyxa sp. WMMC2535]
MADHGHHDPGGHELEAVNTKLLFRLVISLSLVTLLAAMAVIQWFNSQRRELQERYAEQGSFRLAEYETEMQDNMSGVDQVAQGMVGKPDALKAQPAYAGWVNPDTAAASAAAAAPAAVEGEGEDTPEDETEDDPTPGEDAAAVAAEGAQDEVAAPEGGETETTNDKRDMHEKPGSDAKPADGESAKPAKPAAEKADKAEKPAKPAAEKADKAEKPADGE